MAAAWATACQYRWAWDVSGRFPSRMSSIETSATIAMSIPFVHVEVRALDSRGQLVSLDRGYADPSPLGPRQEASYQVMVSNHPAIRKFETVWHWTNE
jgi:hypothetical protein